MIDILTFEIKDQCYGIALDGIEKIIREKNNVAYYGKEGFFVGRVKGKDWLVLDFYQFMIKSSQTKDNPEKDLLLYDDGAHQFGILIPIVKDILQLPNNGQYILQDNHLCPVYFRREKNEGLNIIFLKDFINIMIELYNIQNNENFSRYNKEKCIIFEAHSGSISNRLKLALEIYGLDVICFSGYNAFRYYLTKACYQDIHFFITESELPVIEGYALLKELGKYLRNAKTIIFNHLGNMSPVSKVKFDLQVTPDELNKVFYFIGLDKTRMQISL